MEPLDLVIWFGITVFGVLTALFLTYKWAKPRYIDPIVGSLQTIPARIGKQLSETISNVDVGEIMGQLSGGEVEGNPLAALAGGGGGGIGDLLKLLSQFSGKNKGGGGSSGW